MFCLIGVHAWSWHNGIERDIVNIFVRGAPVMKVIKPYTALFQFPQKPDPPVCLRAKFVCVNIPVCQFQCVGIYVKTNSISTAFMTTGSISVWFLRKTKTISLFFCELKTKNYSCTNQQTWQFHCYIENPSTSLLGAAIVEVHDTYILRQAFVFYAVQSEHFV